MTTDDTPPRAGYRLDRVETEIVFEVHDMMTVVARELGRPVPADPKASLLLLADAWLSEVRKHGGPKLYAARAAREGGVMMLGSGEQDGRGPPH